MFNSISHIYNWYLNFRNSWMFPKAQCFSVWVFFGAFGQLRLPEFILLPGSNGHGWDLSLRSCNSAEMLFLRRDDGVHPVHGSFTSEPILKIQIYVVIFHFQFFDKFCQMFFHVFLGLDYESEGSGFRGFRGFNSLHRWQAQPDRKMKTFGAESLN